MSVILTPWIPLDKLSYPQASTSKAHGKDIIDIMGKYARTEKEPETRMEGQEKEIQLTQLSMTTQTLSETETATNRERA